MDSYELFKNNPENAKFFSNGDNNISVSGNNNTVNQTIHHHHKAQKVKNEITPSDDCIDGHQAQKIKNLIKEIAEKEIIGGMIARNAYSKWHKQLQHKMNVTSYLYIKKENFNIAIGYLSQQNALKRSKTRRRNNAYWRTDMYKAIYTKANELNISKPQLYDIVYKKYGKKISSLTELGEQNLDKLRKFLFNR